MDHTERSTNFSRGLGRRSALLSFFIIGGLSLVLTLSIPSTGYSAATVSRISASPTSTTVSTTLPVRFGPPPPQLPVRPPKPVVYLTFDDGPDPHSTPILLDVLKSYDIPATFFILGHNTINIPDIAVRTVEEGHSVANHTYDHRSLTRSGAAAQLQKTQETIESTTGVRPTCYRPPYGSTNDGVRAAGGQLGLTEWLWDLDTRDWDEKVPNEEIVAALNRTEDHEYDTGLEGPVILMHDAGPEGLRTVEALKIWLEANHKRFDFRVLEGC